MDVFEELVRLRGQGRRCALATIVDAHGSIPGFSAAKLLVSEDGFCVGTIGGGAVEAAVCKAAAAVILDEKPQRLSFDLGKDISQENGVICGGRLEVFIEPVLPAPRAFLFGAGHISRSLCKVLALAGFEPVIVDHRSELATAERFPEALRLVVGEYEDVFPGLSIEQQNFVVIVTSGHKEDLRVLRLALETSARYIAMVGSRRKVASLVREVQASGLPPGALQRLFAPMGLDIGAQAPEEIAVAVAAEMIAVRRGATSSWRSISLSSSAGVFAEAAASK